MMRLLRLLVRAVVRYPRLFVYPQFALVCVCVFVTVDRLKFDMNRNNLVGADKEYHRNFLTYAREFHGQGDLVVVVQSGDIEKKRQFVERLGRRLEGETDLFADVFYKGDLKMMGQKALLFVPDEQVLVDMLERLKDARPVLRSFSEVTNLNGLFRQVNRQFRSASGERTEGSDALMKALPALARVATQAAEAIERTGHPPSPGVTALFDPGPEAEENLYITLGTNRNRLYLVTARAANEALNETAVHRLREIVRQVQGEVPGLSVGLTGEPVLEVDEMAQSRRDSTKASVVTLLLCAVLFVYSYRETGRPLKAVLCLVVGLAYTLGFTTLAIGHLNLLTVTFLPILIGLGIDFGIHLVTRYEEELRGGHPEPVAMEIAVVNTGIGIFTGCLTTAGAFLAMSFTDFKGIEEMGLISGAGLIICLIPMLTLLPALLLRGRQNVLDHHPALAIERRARIERLWLDRPALVLGGALSLAAAAVTQFGKVSFDYNLLHMQAQGLPAVLTEQTLIDAASKSVIFGIVVADSLPEAVELDRRLRALPTVASVDSMVPYLSENPTRKLALIGEIKAQLADLEFAELDAEPVDVSELRQTLQTSSAYFGLGARGAESAGEEDLSEELREVRSALGQLRRQMTDAAADVVSIKLGQFQRALFQDLRETFDAIKNQDNRAALRVEDLPGPLRNRFVSESGTRYLLQVNPKSDVWDRANQEVFVRELRQVAPGVTGTPVQLYEYTTLLKDSYIEAACHALAAIAILVFIHFRRLVCVLLALSPVALGATWTVGWMGWMGVQFNPANIMTLPLVVGVGVTNGIHILNRFAEERNPSILARSTGKAVLLSALTTMMGFGSLCLAQHQGIASLGIVMACGTGACMAAGLAFLPTLLNWMDRRGWPVAPPLHGRRPDRQ
ncbi:MAG TPA: MMPL family transporter [Candidatus Paceibacterota bacterium]|nr:MMPL family transporter [Candidatus Paceibacterota bacterium]